MKARVVALLRGLSLILDLAAECNGECRLVRHGSGQYATPYLRTWEHKRQQGLIPCHAKISQIAS